LFTLEGDRYWTLEAPLLFAKLDNLVMNSSLQLRPMAKANESEALRLPILQLYLVTYLKHDPVRQTKPVVGIQAGLHIFKLSRPRCEVY